MTTEQTGVWIDPPPVKRGGYDWEAVASKVMKRPNKWYRVFQQDKVTYVVAMKAGHIGALKPRYGFTFQTRNNKRDPQRVCDLYIRYDPKQDERKAKK